MKSLYAMPAGALMAYADNCGATPWAYSGHSGHVDGVDLCCSADDTLWAH